MTYWISIVTEACIFSIMALGVNVIWGWAGDFDLALYGYVALGVYLTIAMTAGPPLPPVQYVLGWNLPYALAVLLSVLIVLPIAAIVGAVALRNLRDIYFAITTLGVISVLYVIVQIYTPLFNGFNGLSGSTGGSFAEVGNGAFVSYSIGLEMRIPIGGNIKGDREKAAAMLVIGQAQLQSDAMEKQIAAVTVKTDSRK